MKPLEEAYRARNQSFQFDIRAERGKVTPEILKKTLGLRASQVKRFIAQGIDKKRGEEAVHALITQISSKDAASFSQKLEALSFVHAVKLANRTTPKFA